MILIAARPKLHHPSQYSLASVPKLNDLREQLGEEKNTNRIITPITPIAPIVTPIAPISTQMQGLLSKMMIIS